MNDMNQSKARKLLAVFAHPDDETFICGGTLAKYAAEGVEITLVSATRGEMGRRMGNPPYLNRETIAAAREKELQAACDSLGIGRLMFLDIRDKTVEFIDEESLTARIENLIQDIAPDVVLTFHEKLGGHPDHCSIGKATTAAYHRARCKGALYFISFGDRMEHPEPYGYAPEDILKIDVSDHLESKLAAFRAHRCQSEIDEWVWLPDSEALDRFGKVEYFINGDASAPILNSGDLFQPAGSRPVMAGVNH
ncbi:bacillithiol biosynthesis deacetylase BshB2 [Fontibacillus phaseoli]|uniref:Bacillithiol biosynthesis deacetylase BshB2 n=1 Tax=Fontibacillus phaseoli TaxID=1416533 RepID=A0A369BH16_9BACL|nr:PIG-L family deacetylase [Fontibacillus phaseoli]RCX20701.1 bacillithiol biosynthesis deacetylase BshB2 [Fontibacillus phaseoli]